MIPFIKEPDIKRQQKFILIFARGEIQFNHFSGGRMMTKLFWVIVGRKIAASVELDLHKRLKRKEKKESIQATEHLKSYFYSL